MATYKLKAEAPNKRKGEDKWSAELSVNGISIMGYGKTQEKAIIDAVKTTFQEVQLTVSE